MDHPGSGDAGPRAVTPGEELVDQCRAAASGHAVADLTGVLDALVFRGPDRASFLHGVLTSDVKGLSAGKGQPACLLTPKGRVVAHFALYDAGGDLVAVLPSAALPGVLATLSKLLPLSDTVVDPAGWQVRADLGPKARELFRPDGQGLGPWDCRPMVVTGSEPGRGFIASWPMLGRDCVLTLAPKATLPRGGPRPVELVPAAFALLRVDAGLPMPQDFDENSLPLEYDALEAALSLDKGCYMGQESVAMIRSRGHVNRKLVGIELDRPAPEGLALRAGGEAVGKVTTAVPHLPLALALLRAAHASPGARLEGTWADSTWTASVVPFPCASSLLGGA